MRIAYFSPLSPQRSGISDYSEELLPALARDAEIDLFVDGFVPTNPAICAAFQIHDYRKNPTSLNGHTDYDALVCQMGNSHRYHRGVFEVASTHPAVVVFHVTLYGAAVSSVPIGVPSTCNTTPTTPTSSVADAVTAIVPPTVD